MAGSLMLRARNLGSFSRRLLRIPNETGFFLEILRLDRIMLPNKIRRAETSPVTPLQKRSQLIKLQLLPCPVALIAECYVCGVGSSQRGWQRPAEVPFPPSVGI